MLNKIKKVIKKNHSLELVAKKIYYFWLGFMASVLKTYYNLFDKEAGVSRYNAMQKRSYQNYTKNYEDSRNLCVGHFEAHEKYPYEEYLLANYSGKNQTALDFACGMGRMMNRMLHHFENVDGVDLSYENIEYAKKYLHENNINPKRYTLYQSDGKGVKGIEKKYNFIYSTIALQHISVYEIRKSIFSDLYNLLDEDGSCCFQMGFGYDNGVHWFDNNFVARETNAGCDVCIPNELHLKSIAEDFKFIGYSDVKFDFKISPHPEFGNRYHPIWIFISLKK